MTPGARFIPKVAVHQPISAVHPIADIEFCCTRVVVNDYKGGASCLFENFFEFFSLPFLTFSTSYRMGARTRIGHRF